MLEFLLIVVLVVAFLAFLSWKPVRRFMAAILDLSILIFVVLVISLVIWLALQA